MAAGCNCKAAIGCVDARAPVRRARYVSLHKWPESDAEFVKSVAMARRQGGGGGQESPGGAGAGASSYHYYHYNGSGSMRNNNNSGELLAAAAGYGGSPRVVDSYSCRQMYLRSYTFSKRKETVPERTMACLGRVRERGAAAVFPLFLPQRHGGGGGGPSSSTAAAASDAGSVGSASTRIGVARGESRDDDVLGLRGSGSKQQQARKQQSRRRRRRKKKGCAVVRRLHEASCGSVRAIFRRLLACTTSVDVADGGAPPPQP